MELGKGNDRPFRCRVSEACLCLARLGTDRGLAWGRYALPSRDPGMPVPSAPPMCVSESKTSRVSSESGSPIAAGFMRTWTS